MSEPSPQAVAFVKRMLAVHKHADIHRIRPDPDGFYCMSQVYNLVETEWKRREAAIRSETKTELDTNI